VGQRFAFSLPIAMRDVATGIEGHGFTQDLSSRGVFLITDMALLEGSEIDLTLNMPSEITLGETMRVRCRGRILRVNGPTEASHAETKIGAAVCLKGYEYLPEVAEGSKAFNRISALHSHPETKDDRPATPFPELTARS
jgi:hypothetical protein